jgi:LTXXQ motif family protein
MAKLSSQLGLILILSVMGVALAASPNRGSRGGGVAHFRGGGAAHFSAPRVPVPRVSPFRGHVARSVARPRFAHSRPQFHRRGNVSVAKYTARHLRHVAPSKTTAHVTASTRAVRSALHAPLVRKALQSRRELRNPNTRSLITSRLATAGWRRGHRQHDWWWRHRHGGFGWVGPVFWPFAFFDFYDYVLWGPEYDDVFWDYGYGDVYAGVFGPYGYDDLEGYVVASGRAQDRVLSRRVMQMCGEDSRDLAGIPIDQVRHALQLDNEQSAALDALADASAEAARIIKAACPSDVALTAPARLAAMQARVEAMFRAARVVEPVLDKFYGMLSDEQKARLNGLGQRRQAAASSLQSCGALQSGVAQWPAAEINRAVQPTEAQRVKLDALEAASSQAAEGLRAACPDQHRLTPAARLTAVVQRLEVMVQAVNTVQSALNAFYASLSDEQRAQFDAIGRQRTAGG